MRSAIYRPEIYFLFHLLGVVLYEVIEVQAACAGIRLIWGRVWGKAPPVSTRQYNMCIYLDRR